MAERPKFRRKKRQVVDDVSDVLSPRPAEDDAAPIAPLETRDQRLARRAEESTRDAQAEAARKADAQARTQDMQRRGVEARAEAKRRAAEEAQAEKLRERQAMARLEQRKRAQRLAQQTAAAETAAQTKAKAQAEQDAREVGAKRIKAERAAQRQAETREREAQAESETDARRSLAEVPEQPAKAEAEQTDRQVEAARTAAQARAKAKLQAEEKARRDIDLNKHREAQAKAGAETATRAQAEDAAQAHEATGSAQPAQDTSEPLQLKSPMLAPAPGPETTAVGDAWAQLAQFSLDENDLERQRIITAARRDPAHSAFDVLRTRLLQALAERGWSRVAITSPTKDCGKTFTTANLAISLARQENCATVVLDLDMRAPSLHTVFGIAKPGSIGDVLRGQIPAQDHLRRPAPNNIHVGRSIAFGFSDVREDYASELLQDPSTAKALAEMQDRLRPDVVLYDMPPALSSDDVIAFRAHFDAVLLIVGGGVTTDSEIKEVERRLGDQTPLLGMVLNKAEGTSSRQYSY